MILWLLVTSRTTVIMTKPSLTCYKQPRSVMWSSTMTSSDTSKMKRNFWGIYTTSGHKPSKDKVSAITAMPSPTNKKQVQMFIGMINHLSKLSLRLSELADQPENCLRIKYHLIGDLSTKQPSHRLRKKLQVLQYSHTITPRSEPFCRWMPVSKVLVLVYYKMTGWYIFQARLSLLSRKVMWQLN